MTVFMYLWASPSAVDSLTFVHPPPRSSLIVQTYLPVSYRTFCVSPSVVFGNVDCSNSPTRSFIVTNYFTNQTYMKTLYCQNLIICATLFLRGHYSRYIHAWDLIFVICHNLCENKFHSNKKMFNSTNYIRNWETSKLMFIFLPRKLVASWFTNKYVPSYALLWSCSHV